LAKLGEVLPYLEMLAKQLMLLETNWLIFSKYALKSLNNQTDFDSAIRRFDPSRPSQLILRGNLSLFWGAIPNAFRRHPDIQQVEIKLRKPATRKSAVLLRRHLAPPAKKWNDC
jgi:hypothetical protein